MLLLVALSLVVQSPVPSTEGRAEARLQIVRGASISEQGWRDIPLDRRREKIIVEEGARAFVRVIEFE